ncbi:MAG: BatA domain-containing protein [Gemmatimonadetes bacterium]|nr:BatA domain-containing protein [Gemmatimonadota bacterium]
MFATPLWLAALAALAIPLALHLWSRRPRQVVKVGTLRHLDGLPAARARSARLSDPLLLLLRLFILAATVLGLAGPRLRGGTVGLPSRLVLVEARLAADPLLDSLNQAGATVRLLAPGLPEIQLPAKPRVVAALGPWEALAEADRLVAPDGVIDLYAHPRLAALGAERPALRATVRWHAPAPTAERRWLADLSAIPGDSLQGIVGRGNAGGITYTRIRATDRAAFPDESLTTTPLTPRRLALDPPDSLAARRAGLAIRAVSEALGQVVTLATATDGDTALSLPTSQFGSDALADTLLARWPWRPAAADLRDPREVTVATALPRVAPPRADADLAPRTRELLLLVALLLLGERWLARRPRRSAA